MLKIKNCKNEMKVQTVDNEINETRHDRTKLVGKCCKIGTTMYVSGLFLIATAFAGDDYAQEVPETDVELGMLNNLNAIIFQIIQIIGVAVAAFGVYQLAMSIPSHDTTQRAGGMAACAGGLIMILVKPILTAVGAVAAS